MQQGFISLLKVRILQILPVVQMQRTMLSVFTFAQCYRVQVQHPGLYLSSLSYGTSLHQRTRKFFPFFFSIINKKNEKKSSVSVKLLNHFSPKYFSFLIL